MRPGPLTGDQVDRLLDVRHGSKIDQLEAAAQALDSSLMVSLVPREQHAAVAFKQSPRKAAPRARARASRVHAGVLAAQKAARRSGAGGSKKNSAVRVFAESLTTTAWLSFAGDYSPRPYRRRKRQRNGGHREALPVAPPEFRGREFPRRLNVAGVRIAAGILYPWFGLLLTPMIASAAMTFSSVSLIGNALRLRRVEL